MNLLLWFRNIPVMYSEMFAVVLPVLQTGQVALVLYVALLMTPVITRS